MELITLRGVSIRAHLPALAELRIAVFRDWPYLYDGDPDYEQRYLDAYARCDDAAIVLAMDGTAVVGAASCLPLAAETAEVTEPFRTAGHAIERIAYFGESVLRPEWRGQGIGVGFFRAREAHARLLPGIDTACFCSVRRPVDHPARPADAVTLDGFWRRRGYTPVPGLACSMSWRDVGEASETVKTLDVWMRRMDEDPP